MTSTSRLATGSAGLDEILHGGFVAERNYMFRGPAGSGKTILGFHFLEAGVENGETALFINLEEDLDDLRTNAAALGFDTDAIEFLDLSPSAEAFTEDDSYDIFGAAEVEQEPLTSEIVDAVAAVDPDRVVVDPLTQLRYLVADDYQFRKQVVGFMRYLKQQGATAVFTVQNTRELPTEDLEFIADGTIKLEAAAYGRTITVPKFRGSTTRSGEHAYRITDDGIRVFPILEPSDHTADFPSKQLSSGISEIDDLLHGGLERGTVTVVSGPTGVGKTTAATAFLSTAAANGQTAIAYLFEESLEMFTQRSETFGYPITDQRESGSLYVDAVDSLSNSPEEFAHRVRTHVEENDAEMVVIDGIAGYKTAIKGDENGVGLRRRLQALTQYLTNMNVSVILIDQRNDVMGLPQATSENVSYIADNIIFQNYIELEGDLQRIVGVLKKRLGGFETVPRRYRITGDGLEVGEPVTGIHGVFEGIPQRTDGATRSSE